jgi:hypothetical protein
MVTDREKRAIAAASSGMLARIFATPLYAEIDARIADIMEDRAEPPAELLDWARRVVW